MVISFCRADADVCMIMHMSVLVRDKLMAPLVPAAALHTCDFTFVTVQLHVCRA